jgi:thermostable 8-oxoguanine DNA glycosylase
MRIISFAEVIKQLPEDQHSFSIKKTNWNNIKEVVKFFDKNDSMNISRSDLFELGESSEEVSKEFIIKVLMWGYPTGGRGKNIQNALAKIDDISQYLTSSKKNNINEEDLINGIKLIRGIGLSTLSKFLYFLKIEMKEYPTIILDLRLITMLRKAGFDELTNLKEITYSKGPKMYYAYLKEMSSISKEIGCSVGQLEMFLFIFGSNLKEKLST